MNKKYQHMAAKCHLIQDTIFVSKVNACKLHLAKFQIGHLGFIIGKVLRETNYNQIQV